MQLCIYDENGIAHTLVTKMEWPTINKLELPTIWQKWLQRWPAKNKAYTVLELLKKVALTLEWPVQNWFTCMGEMWSQLDKIDLSLSHIYHME